MNNPLTVEDHRLAADELQRKLPALEAAVPDAQNLIDTQRGVIRALIERRTAMLKAPAAQVDDFDLQSIEEDIGWAQEHLGRLQDDFLHAECSVNRAREGCRAHEKAVADMVRAARAAAAS